MEEFRQEYTRWALRNYLEAAKTKTVSRAKYERILGTLRGEFRNCAENSKFRFWIRSKGFRISRADNEEEGEILLVGTQEVSGQIQSSLARVD
jgi:hypothetical protein